MRRTPSETALGDDVVSLMRSTWRENTNSGVLRCRLPLDSWTPIRQYQFCAFRINCISIRRKSTGSSVALRLIRTVTGGSEDMLAGDVDCSGCGKRMAAGFKTPYQLV